MLPCCFPFFITVWHSLRVRHRSIIYIEMLLCDMLIYYYNTNLHVDPAQINTYLGFFIISSVVLFVTCIAYSYKRIGKGILDIVIMSLIYFSLNYSIIICSFVYSLIVILILQCISFNIVL